MNRQSQAVNRDIFVLQSATGQLMVRFTVTMYGPYIWCAVPSNKVSQ
jgi:hypothetical protein